MSTPMNTPPMPMSCQDYHDCCEDVLSIARHKDKEVLARVEKALEPAKKMLARVEAHRAHLNFSTERIINDSLDNAFDEVRRIS